MRPVRFITENFGRYYGDSVEAYQALGGFVGLERARAMSRETLCAYIKSSGLQGRGGAAYSTGLKWEQALAVQGPHKVVICNADEGEPCTFKDRDLLSKDFFRVVEGIVIAAYAVNAERAYIYLREEYSHLRPHMDACLESFKKMDILESVGLQSIQIYSGAGAYVCGEGSSLIESMEGKSGRPRIKPPYIKQAGLFQQPTLVNNVETLACVTAILKNGVEAFKAHGTEGSPGTKLISLAGNVNQPGTYEIPFGMTINEIIRECGGGVTNQEPVQFLQLGGASGRLGRGSDLEIPYTYEDLKAAKLDVGSGGFLVAGASASLLDFLTSVQAFFTHECCGKCTPCREGNRHISTILNKWSKDSVLPNERQLVKRLATIMKSCSFCGLGEGAQNALLSAMVYFPEVFDQAEV